MTFSAADLNGQYGVWRSSNKVDGPLAAEIEHLGFASLWLGGAPGEFGPLVLELLDATESLVIATGIASIWMTPPDDAVTVYREIEAAHPGRFLLGIGPAHRESVGDRAVKPYTALTEYLDRLDALWMPRDRVVLAALGPRVLELARDRAAGAHPYLVTPDHTKEARGLLGADALLVPEQHVILDEDPRSARATAREALSMYLGLVNYRRSWLRQGYTEQELDDGGSDRFVDDVVAHGSADTIAAALRAHLAAGADQVLTQVIGDGDPLPALTTIAAALGLATR
jgi:probable F420-dependent oxidoreductase